MSDIQPIKDYLAAVDAHRAGDRRAACQSLATAMGADRPSPVIESAIGKLLAPETPANDVALKLVANQSARRGKEHDRASSHTAT